MKSSITKATERIKIREEYREGLQEEKESEWAYS